MKFQRVFQIIIAISVLFVLVSCGGNSQLGDSGGSSKMTPTDEYNYLFESEHLNTIIKPMAGEFGFESIDSLFEIAGYGEADIKGKTDGTRVVLEVTFPVLKGFEEKAKLLSKLASDRISLSGRVRTDHLVGYIKAPGLQSLVDTVHDYYDILIENDESPTGNSNPLTQAFGLAMLSGVNIEEDIFAWMGDEMGVLFFLANDKEEYEYVGGAFAISIKNKKTAMDKVYNLLKKAGKFSGMDFDIDEVLSVQKYKSFTMHVFNTGLPKDASSEFGLDMSQPGILYANDFMFISNNVYNLEQLADNYDPGGAQDESAAFAASFDLDELLKHSAKSRREYSEDLKKQLAHSPEEFALANDLSDKFEKIVQDNTFGNVKKTVKFTPDSFIVRVEFNKSILLLHDFYVDNVIPYILDGYIPEDNGDDEIEV